MTILSFQIADGQVKIQKEQIAEAEKLLDLTFTDAERDSLINAAQDYLLTYKTMHGLTLDNALAPALTFDPITARGFKMPVAKPNHWKIPAKVDLPVNRADLAFYSIPELASLIKNRKITAVALTRFFIERVKKYSDTLHCLVSLTEDIAIQEAKKADAEIAAGQYRGILHGIPYGVKDLFAVKNTLTTWGAAPFKNQRIEEDAAVVQLLRQSGAVLIAKLSMGSLAMGDVWFDGITRNPWDLTQGASGSSAGSASAVAAGLLPFAIGTETQGSIVSPSTRCGTSGIRPTFGRVNRAGGMTLCWSLDKVGPIARSAYDAAIVLSAINGGDLPGDKAARNVPFVFDEKMNLKKRRIAYPKNLFDSIKKDRNEWRTIEAFEKMGITLEPIIWKTQTPTRIMGVVLMSEAAAAFDALTRSNLDDELTLQTRNAWPNLFRAARFIPAVEYINANRLRTQMMAEVDAILRGYDCVIMPSFDGGILPITNLTGHPAIVVPNGFLNGRPTSITFLGNLFDDALIAAVAKAFQEATDFEDKHPPFFKQ
jgi:Asp-tRNA(Asn)/Glu-tRNA(Gln) amidotransferase A subunit family amidase